MHSKIYIVDSIRSKQFQTTLSCILLVGRAQLVQLIAIMYKIYVHPQILFQLHIPGFTPSQPHRTSSNSHLHQLVFAPRHGNLAMILIRVLLSLLIQEGLQFSCRLQLIVPVEEPAGKSISSKPKGRSSTTASSQQSTTNRTFINAAQIYVSF